MHEELQVQAAQFLGTGTADRDARSVVELRLDVPARVTPECAHVIEIHHVSTMHLDEAPRIEPRDQVAEREMEEMPAAAGVSDHVIAICLQPGHTVDGNRHGGVADSRK